MNKTFTIDSKTFRQVPSTNGCIGCGGSVSNEMCSKISDYVSDRDYKSCTGQGVIYMEVKK